MDEQELAKAIEEAEENPDSAKMKILEAGESLFAREGYKGTTTRDVAEAAGVNTALVHYHWGSKEDLWKAVNLKVFMPAFERTREIQLQAREARDPIESIEFVVSALFNILADNPNIPLLIQEGRRMGEVRPFAAELGVPILQMYIDFIEANTDLDFGPVETKLALYLLIGVFEWFFTRPELVQLFFDEDTADLSPDFRERANKAISVLFARFGQKELPDS